MQYFISHSTSDYVDKKTALKRHLLSIVFATLSLIVYASNAYDFEVEKIRFSVVSTTELTAEVSGFSPFFKSGKIIDIPAQVEYRGRTLSVVGIAKNAFEDIPENSISLNLGSLSYIKEQPDNTVFSIHAQTPEQFISGSCYPIAPNCKKTYFVNGGVLTSLYNITSSDVEFRRVNSLKEIDLHNCKITNMPAFSSCENLERAFLPNGAILPEAAFKDCEALKQVIINEYGTYKAGNYAFSGCSSLIRIDGWFDSRSLRLHTFDNCPRLESLSLSKNVAYFGTSYKTNEYPFKGTTNIREINIQSLESWMNIDYYSGDYYYDGHTTQGLENFALLLNGIPVEDINIDGDFKTIKPNTFYGVNTLRSVVVGPSIEAIGWKAFYNCPNLTKVELKNGIKEVGEEAFALCQIEHLDVPASVESFREDAFSGVRTIDFWCEFNKNEQIHLGPLAEELGLHNTGYSGSWSAKGLKRVRVESSYDDESAQRNFTFVKQAFTNCSNLEHLSIDKIEGNCILEEECFAGTALTELSFPSNCYPRIMSGAFRDCKQLKKVVFGYYATAMGHSDKEYTQNGIRYKGVAPFYNCPNLSSITLWSDLTIPTFWSLRSSYASSRQFKLPHTNLTPWYNCPVSEFIISDDSWEISIDSHMNLEYPLRHLVIGKNTEVIQFSGKNAKEDTHNGNDTFLGYSYDYKIDPYIVIESRNPVPPTIKGKLTTDIYMNATVRIPENSLELYKESPSWKPFWNFVEVPMSDVDVVEIAPSEVPNDIYNLQGICIKRNATNEDIKSLLPGLYIVGGKKISIE